MSSILCSCFLLLLSYSDGVANADDYYLVAFLRSFKSDGLYSFEDFVNGVGNLLAHHGNGVADVFLHDNRVDGNVIFSDGLFNLELVHPWPANSRANSFGNLADAFAFKAFA